MLKNMDQSQMSGMMMNQANDIWKMLDDLADTSPEDYAKFIQTQMQNAPGAEKPSKLAFSVQTRREGKAPAALVCNFIASAEVSEPPFHATTPPSVGPPS